MTFHLEKSDVIRRSDGTFLNVRIILRHRRPGVDLALRVVALSEPMARHNSLIINAVTSGILPSDVLPEEARLVIQGYCLATQAQKHVIGLPAHGELIGAWDASGAGSERFSPELHAIIAQTLNAKSPTLAHKIKGYLCLSSEWISGPRLDRGWSDMSERAQLRCLELLLKTLASLHAQNIAYCDLKPQNIVVRHGENGLNPYLIDLDTMRKMGPSGHVPVHDLTKEYAAPEQLGRGFSCLASDLYSFARLIEKLHSLPRLKASWRAPIKRCKAEAPQDRPSATELLALIDPSSTWEGVVAQNVSTSRVPEPSTSRVPEPSTSRVPEPNLFEVSARNIFEVPRYHSDEEDVDLYPLKRKKKWLGCSGCLLLLVFAWIVVCCGRCADPEARDASSREAAEANAQAEVAFKLLKTQKTVPSKNNSIEMQRVLTNARSALKLYKTSRATGVYALAYVWQQGWHFSSARKTRWDEAKYRSAQQVVQEALTGSPDPTGLLAKAMLEGHVCRLVKDRRRRDQACKNAPDYYKTAIESIHEPWLRVEANWAAEMVHASELRRLGARSTEGRAHGEQGLERCEAAKAMLDQAPVNGVGLIKDCLEIAGRLQRWPEWFEWADQLLDLGVSRSSVRRVHRMALPSKCWPRVNGSPGNIVVDPRLTAPLTFETPAQRQAAFCYTLGLAATRCLTPAQHNWWRKERRQLTRQTNLPWDDAYKAWRRLPSGKCRK